MICFCGKELIHSGDHMYDECGYEGNGIVSNLTCPNDDCEVEIVFAHRKLEDADNNQGKTEATQKA